MAFLNDIFQAKNVPVDLLSGMKEQHEMHRLDWSSVKDSVSAPLEDFDFYFYFVLEKAVRILQALRVE